MLHCGIYERHYKQDPIAGCVGHHDYGDAGGEGAEYHAKASS